ncbi:2-hydroxyacid dehydrogenase [Paracoccus methylarcula]|uniref:2-hydroxyacid dehydrogenase n=1 Tax=Paracoccus methylarcula TaxID=72022 RepID=A0A3R7M9Q8_9RHOB|nr:2-hydroxyacid dehydrogenase [Paracoccus methylarcula]RNF35014.1 2-hydroxyacid dehydrogenase [Paracoccus methylarcula]
MKDILAIGAYPDWALDALIEDFGARQLSGPEALAELSQEERGRVRAVAYKGHKAFDASVMDMLPNLGLIANFGVGFDAIDIAAASERGIKVTNTPDVLNDDVADLAVALLIGQSRKLVEGSDWVRSGQWAEKGEMPMNRKVSGGKAGILGLGRIGREIADRLAAFKMEMHYYARSPKDTPGWTYHSDPVELAGAVDYLIVSLVGGPATEGFVTAGMLDALGPDGIIVNISRGSVIDEAALLDALEQNRIRGAGLDVFASEPNIDPRFLALDNVLLQPHQGSDTVETRAAMASLQRDNLRAFRKGEALLTPVN